MENNHNRTCTTCGKEYRYCPKCTRDKDKPKWLFAFCSEECKEIYQILNDEQYKRISTAEAKARLSKVDMSEKTFDEATQAVIDRILSYSGYDTQDNTQEMI